MKTTTPKTFSKAEQIKAINRAWLFVGDALDNISQTTKYGTRLESMNAEEERSYRRSYAGEGRRFQITVAFTARLLSLQWILKYMENPKQCTIADVIHCKPSCIYAASLAANYADKIKAALLDSRADMDAIRSADYCKLAK